MRCASVVALIALLAPGCKREQKDPAPTTDPLAPEGLYLTTTTETNARVAKVFPRGVATEYARATIGTAAPPPSDFTAPNADGAIVVQVELAAPAEVATVLAAVPPRPSELLLIVKGMTTSGAWQFVQDPAATGPYTRVAVEIWISDVDAPAPVADLERDLVWARNALGKLSQQPATVSMTAEQAFAKTAAAFKLRDTITEDGFEVGVMVVAPQGKKFPGRLVWDVAYSAGFRWGDGDYFHWVPSPETDISQGIGMGTTTGKTYFMPEWVAANDGSADVDDLEMSFSVARTWQPEAVFEVMVRASTYMARRLGGTVVSDDGTPFDEAAARARVRSLARSMSDIGLTPGTGLALQVF